MLSIAKNITRTLFKFETVTNFRYLAKMSQPSATTAPAVVENEPAVKNERADNDENESQAKKIKLDGNESQSADEKLAKKRKYALLVGYCGEGYFGLQRYFAEAAELILVELIKSTTNF
jgi:hypothetical protein